MKQEEVTHRIDRLNVWKQGGQRAPHKPLLQLYALGRSLRGEDRLIPYAEVDHDLRKLLTEFGPSRLRIRRRDLSFQTYRRRLNK